MKFFRFSWMHRQTPPQIVKAPGSRYFEGDWRNTEFHGRISACRDASCELFTLEIEGMSAAECGELLCCVATDWRADQQDLSTLLRAGQRIRISGHRIVPSVYKPFDFEVLQVDGLPRRD